MQRKLLRRKQRLLREILIKPLLDGDIFLYEIGACGQYYEPVEEGEEKGELLIRSFDFVQELLENRIEEICKAVGATEPPTIFFTGKGNFRFEIAKTKPYKGNRKDVEKPFHHENILVYLKSAYECITAEDCEADDELAMAQMVNIFRFSEDYDYYGLVEQVERDKFLSVNCKTVICTRDKDLRMIPGWHYGWECGLQPEFELQWVSEMGELIPTYRTKLNKEGEEVEYLHKLSGTGMKWFYAQLLMGDPTDNIPGCPGVGMAKIYPLLKDLTTEREMYSKVLLTYFDKVGLGSSEAMLEQAYLLWMVRERDEGGKLIMWEPPSA